MMVDYKLKDGVTFQDLVDLGFYNSYYDDVNYYVKELSRSTCIIVYIANREVQKWKSRSTSYSFNRLSEELPITERTLKKAGLVGKVTRRSNEEQACNDRKG